MNANSEVEGDSTEKARFTELAQSLNATLDLTSKRPKFSTTCPVAGCGKTLVIKDFDDGDPALIRSCACSDEAIWSAIESLQARPIPPSGRDSEAGEGSHPSPAAPPNGCTNGYTNGNGKVHLPEVNLDTWRYRLHFKVRNDIEEACAVNPEWLQGMTRDAMVESAVSSLRAVILRREYRPPALTQSEIDEELRAVAIKTIDAEFPETLEERPADEFVICEDFDTAVAANEEYLKREAIVDRLFYSQAISLFVGGKHHGKTTLARTAAMSIMRGVRFLGREVKQGPVIYAASDDEVAATRMELLRMGWNGKSDPLTLLHIHPNMVGEPERVLEQIAKIALKQHAVFIVLDMLFDFAAIRDEMSYAGTREAIGKVQSLADVTLAHVAPTHHSPKYMLDTMTAGQAALGSQGIAARFSPIVLTRKWAEGLYTVESTMTRDPRGEAIKQTCVEIDANGWAHAAGEFKTWMKWRIYAPRVMGLIEGGEPGKRWSVFEITKELQIGRPEAQNALYQLVKAQQLDREPKKQSFLYFLPDKSGIFGSN